MTEERLRVAQEVHDVVGHGLAVIAMQSGVALHVLERNPDKARDALEAIRATSKDSLGDLRRELDQTAVAVVRQTLPDIVLMDIRMPIRDGRTALVDITSDPMLADVRVIMLTTFEHDEYILDSLRNGASGFLLKDDEPTELLHAVQAVAEGGSLLSLSVTRRVIKQFATRSSTTTVPHPDLARQLVMFAVRSGLTIPD